MAFKSKNLVLRKLIVLIMGVLILSMPVFATSNKTVGVSILYDKVSINAGESIKVTIGLKDFNGVVGGIQALKFVISYDSTNFTCSHLDKDNNTVFEVAPGNASVSEGELNITPSENKLVILYLSSNSKKSVKTDDPMMVITFTAINTAKSGTYEFGLSTGTTSTFVDCDTDTQKRDVKPIMPTVLLQKITVGNSDNPVFDVSTSSSSSNPSGSSIANNPANVEQIKQKIDALPDKITEKDKPAVDQINKDINALSQSDKDKIANNEKLKQANAEIDKLTEQGTSSNNVMIFVFIGLGLVLLVATFLIVKVIRGSRLT